MVREQKRDKRFEGEGAALAEKSQMEQWKYTCGRSHIAISSDAVGRAAPGVRAAKSSEFG